MAGLTLAKNCSPAGVSETLRVVLLKSRTPRRDSSDAIAWLNAEAEMPDHSLRHGNSYELRLPQPRSARKSLALALYEIAHQGISDYMSSKDNPLAL
jgi:hypothetical protein